MTMSKTLPLSPRVLTYKMKGLDQVTSEVFPIPSSDVLYQWFLTCISRTSNITTPQELVRNATPSPHGGPLNQILEWGWQSVLTSLQVVLIHVPVENLCLTALVWSSGLDNL